MFEKYLKSAIFLALYPLAMLASNLHEFIALSQNNESYLIKQMQSEQANLDKEQAF
ncbi:TolC family protein, partial [Campylobacter jejuni]|nr:TolC family protein [Campylobacter jejuni]